MYCYSCGKEVGDDMQFCPSCGANLNKNAPQASNTSDDSKLYDVVLLDAGRARIHLIKHLNSVYGMDMASANRLLSSDNCIIAEGLPFDAALELATKFEAEGAKVDVKENGVPYVPTVIPTPTKENSKPHAPTPEQKKTVPTDKKKKHFKAAILDFAASATIAIACLLVIFLPLFKFTDNSTSMFKIAINYIKSFDFENFNAQQLIKILPLVAFAYVVAMTVRAIIPCIKKAGTLLRFDEKYVEIENAKPENVEQFLKNRKFSQSTILYELLGDITVFYFTSRAVGLDVAFAAICAALIVASFICGLVSKAVTRSANN